MANSQTITYNVVINTTQAKSALKRLDAKAKEIGGKKTTTAEKSLNGITGGANKATSALGGLLKTLGPVAAGLGAVTLAYKGLTKAVATAAEFQQLETRLSNLYGSTLKGAQIFKEFKQVAATTPFQVQNIVNAGAQLKAFGVISEKSLNLFQLTSKEVLSATADLAAFMGTDVVDAANAMGRAFSGGAGAADVLRERGILELVKSFAGVEDLTKLTLPEFRKALIGAMQDPASGIIGATKALSKTYLGSVSNMKDAISAFEDSIGKQLLPTLQSGILAATNFIRSLLPVEDRLSAASVALEEFTKEGEALKSNIKIFEELSTQASLNEIEQVKLEKALAAIVKTVPGAVTEYDKYGNVLSINTGLAKELYNQQLLLMRQNASSEIEKFYKAYEKNAKAIGKNIDEYERLSAVQKAYDDIAESNKILFSTEKEKNDYIEKTYSEQIRLINKYKSELDITDRLLFDSTIYKKLTETLGDTGIEIASSNEKMTAFILTLAGMVDVTKTADQIAYDLSVSFSLEKDKALELAEAIKALGTATSNIPKDIDLDFTKNIAEAYKNIDGLQLPELDIIPPKTSTTEMLDGWFNDIKSDIDSRPPIKSSFKVYSELDLEQNIDSILGVMETLKEYKALGLDVSGGLITAFNGLISTKKQLYDLNKEIGDLEFEQTEEGIKLIAAKMQAEDQYFEWRKQKYLETHEFEMDLLDIGLNQSQNALEILLDSQLSFGEKAISIWDNLKSAALSFFADLIKEYIKESVIKKGIESASNAASVAQAVITGRAIAQAMSGAATLNLVATSGGASLGALAGLTATATAVQSVAKYAEGGDFTTKGPELILVGDNPGGREQVQITPLSSPNINGPKDTPSRTPLSSPNLYTPDDTYINNNKELFNTLFSPNAIGNLVSMPSSTNLTNTPNEYINSPNTIENLRSITSSPNSTNIQNEYVNSPNINNKIVNSQTFSPNILVELNGDRLSDFDLAVKVDEGNLARAII